MVFAVSGQGVILEYDPAFRGNPWQVVSGQGGFTSISATHDASGAVLFAVPGDGSLWELDSGVWQNIYVPYGFTSISGTVNFQDRAVVYAVPEDGTMLEYNPVSNSNDPWQVISGAGGFTAISATVIRTQPGMDPVVFACPTT